MSTFIPPTEFALSVITNSSIEGNNDQERIQSAIKLYETAYESAISYNESHKKPKKQSSTKELKIMRSHFN